MTRRLISNALYMLKGMPSTTAIILLLLCLFSSGISAQGIVNTEKYDLDYGKRFNLGSEFSYEMERGNTDINSFELDFFSSYIKTPHIVRLIGGFDHLNSDGKEIKSNVYGQVRYNHAFAPWFQSFTFYQIQRDEILLVNQRNLIGAGGRFIFIPGDSAAFDFDIGIGVMYESEDLNESKIEVAGVPNTEGFRFANFLSMVYNTKLIRFVNITYYQPWVEDFKDYRIFNEAKLIFKVSGYLSISTELLYRLDTRPPEGIKQDDLSLKNGIIVTF